MKFAFATRRRAYVRIVPYHAAMSVAWGLKRDEAIKALTIDAAEILGVADRVGSIEAGKDRQPLHREGRSARDPTTVTHVIINGNDVRPRQQARARCIGSTSRGLTMNTLLRFCAPASPPVALAFTHIAGADAPHSYAIRGAGS